MFIDLCLESNPGLNIGAHQEAAEHFLSALAMQESFGGTKSEQVWFTLRRTFLAMVRLLFRLLSALWILMELI